MKNLPSGWKWFDPSIPSVQDKDNYCQHVPRFHFHKLLAPLIRFLKVGIETAIHHLELNLFCFSCRWLVSHQHYFRQYIVKFLSVYLKPISESYFVYDERVSHFRYQFLFSHARALAFGQFSSKSIIVIIPVALCSALLVSSCPRTWSVSPYCRKATSFGRSVHAAFIVCFCTKVGIFKKLVMKVQNAGCGRAFFIAWTGNCHLVYFYHYVSQLSSDRLQTLPPMRMILFLCILSSHPFFEKRHFCSYLLRIALIAFLPLPPDIFQQ